MWAFWQSANAGTRCTGRRGCSAGVVKASTAQTEGEIIGAPCDQPNGAISRSMHETGECAAVEKEVVQEVDQWSVWSWQLWTSASSHRCSARNAAGCKRVRVCKCGNRTLKALAEAVNGTGSIGGQVRLTTQTGGEFGSWKLIAKRCKGTSRRR